MLAELFEVVIETEKTGRIHGALSFEQSESNRSLNR